MSYYHHTNDYYLANQGQAPGPSSSRRIQLASPAPSEDRFTDVNIIHSHTTPSSVSFQQQQHQQRGAQRGVTAQPRTILPVIHSSTISPFSHHHFIQPSICATPEASFPAPIPARPTVPTSVLMKRKIDELTQHDSTVTDSQDSSITLIDDDPSPPTKKARPTRKNHFWKKQGVKDLIEWLSDPEREDRLRNAGKTEGTRVGDVHKEIALWVNKRANTEWKPDDVRNNIRTIEKKYNEAKGITRRTGEGNDGETTLEERRNDICPYYDQLHDVYASCIIKNPLPLKESTLPQAQRAEPQDFEASDIEADLEADNQLNKSPGSSSSQPRSKKAKEDRLASLMRTVEKAKEVCDSQEGDSVPQSVYHDARSDLKECQKELKQANETIMMLRLELVKYKNDSTWSWETGGFRLSRTDE